MTNKEHEVEVRPSREAGHEGVPQAGSPGNPLTYYTLLIALYNALFAIFTLVYRRSKAPLERITPFDLVLLGLGTLRMAKLVSEDEVTTVLRRPVIEVEGEERHPRGHGLRWAVGKLLLCPTCTGTWIAAALTYALHLAPTYTRPFLAIMSASAIEQSSDALLSLVYTDRDLLRDEEAEFKKR